MKNRQVNVAFVSTANVTPDLWSGTPYYMSMALEEQFNVIHVAPLKKPVSAPLYKGFELLHGALSDRRYHWNREPTNLRYQARQVEEAIATIKPDLVVSYSSGPYAFLRTQVPTLLWPDAIAPSMINYYPEFTKLCERTTRQVLEAERLALENTSLFVGASDWVTQGATSWTGRSVSASATVMYGANLHPDTHLPTSPRRLTPGDVRLLSIGGNWERKGFDLAIETIGELRQRGVAATLDIVGASAPAQVEIPHYVRVHGRLSKNSPADKRQLEALLRNATLFILASDAECLGIVLCEAAAYGLPTVVNNTGGMPDVIERGQHGLVTQAQTAAAYADAVETMLDTEQRYGELSANAFQIYASELNWTSAAKSIGLLVSSRLGL